MRESLQEVLIEYPFFLYLIWVGVIGCAIGAGIELRSSFGFDGDRDGLKRVIMYTIILLFLHTGLLGRGLPEGFLVLLFGAIVGFLSIGLYYFIRSRLSDDKS